MYELLIFDWDGTIIDSEARIISSMKAAAKDLNLAELKDEAVRDIIGLGLPEAIRILIPNVTDEEIVSMRARYGYYYLGVDETETPLFKGVEESLIRLKEQGYRLAVATGKSRAGLERVFADTGLGSLFETSRCADETASKPDPLMVHQILQQTGVDPKHAIMIGDTEFDLSMGVNAGVPVIAVSYGAHHIDRLKQYQPLLEMHQFIDLENWLSNQTSIQTV